MRLRALLVMLFASLFLCTTAAVAGPYPPPVAAGGEVSASRIKLPGCTTFTGHGFAHGTTVTVTDDGRVVGTTKTDAEGRFSLRVCFDVNARVGCHTLVGTGLGVDGRPASVSATVCITGLAEGPGGGEPGGGIPFTGFAATGVALGGIGLVAAGSAILLLMEKRHRSRRRARRVHVSA